MTGGTFVRFLEDTQAEQLLITKLFILKPRSDLVPRPHLSELLEEDMRGKLTLVLARAGYGKSTMLSGFPARSGSLTAIVDPNA